MAERRGGHGASTAGVKNKSGLTWGVINGARHQQTERRRDPDVAHQLRRLGRIEKAASRGTVIGREGGRVLGGRARDNRCREGKRKKSYGDLFRELSGRAGDGSRNRRKNRFSEQKQARHNRRQPAAASRRRSSKEIKKRHGIYLGRGWGSKQRKGKLPWISGAEDGVVGVGSQVGTGALNGPSLPTGGWTDVVDWW